jgi:hypothetical protein
MFVDASRLYCPTCARRLSDDAARLRQQLQLFAVVDPTVCSNCKLDNNSTEFPRTGGRPFCPACRDSLYDRPFPRWLRLSLLGLLALLAFALVHGRKYFRAGRSLYRGEKLLARHQAAAAVPLLESVVRIAPDCEKCILLLAKADFLSGNPQSAFDALKHNDGKFEDNALLAEMQTIAQRVSSAFQDVQEATTLAQANNSSEAAAKVRLAQKLYPEFPAWPGIIDEIDAGVAYERKNYDAFLSLSEKIQQANLSSSRDTAQVASALACKYAATNDPSYRVRAEAELAKARSLAVSPEDKKELEEYEPRILHRLNSRTVISKAEYDRRFRPNLSKQEPAQ